MCFTARHGNLSQTCPRGGSSLLHVLSLRPAQAPSSRLSCPSSLTSQRDLGGLAPTQSHGELGRAARPREVAPNSAPDKTPESCAQHSLPPPPPPPAPPRTPRLSAPFLHKKLGGNGSPLDFIGSFMSSCLVMHWVRGGASASQASGGAQRRRTRCHFTNVLGNKHGAAS